MNRQYRKTHIADELGEFIAQWHWKIWATLSFRSNFRIPYHYLESQWDRLISHIRKLQGMEPYWVRSVEIGREQNMPHIHALIGGTELSPKEIPRLWHPNTGNAKAETYDPDRRAAWYIAKNPESVEFSRNLSRPD